ncbi:unnamed protein product [Closterium sp. NIES-54]
MITPEKILSHRVRDPRGARRVEFLIRWKDLPLATPNASRKPGGGKRGGKPGGKSGGSKKGVSALSCPSPWPELDSCPTSESLPQLEDAQTEFPGAVWGALRPHKVPGARNSPADATHACRFMTDEGLFSPLLLTPHRPIRSCFHCPANLLPLRPSPFPPPSFPPSGLCTLFHSQACRFMTDEGFFSPPVFDPTQTNSFMFPLPCYSAV